MPSRGIFTVVVALLLVAPQLEAFQVVRAPGIVSRGTPSVCPRRSGLQLRMASSPPEPTQEESQKEEEDPYAVKPEVPGFAKQENQWEIDNMASKDASDDSKKTLAIVSGAVAMVLSVAYLAAVVALESRGPLKPPPPEALQSALPIDAAALLALLQ